ncbi:MAG: DNA methyltransferase, partial [Ktedonobacterales bacterium]
MIGAHSHLTYKGNLNHTRHGWLRLTPAYSVHLVANILESGESARQLVLDPFCGTGTTALVCAERGIPCVTTDINPFLVWLSYTKTTRYTTRELADFSNAADDIARTIVEYDTPTWSPPMFQIEKWWSVPVLAALSRMMWRIRSLTGTLAPHAHS